MVRVKRAYAPSAPTDGTRVLVDRLWPRGLVREKLKLDEWTKEIAPSTELRKWFAHKPERWAEFERRYAEELSQPGKKPLLEKLAAHARKGTLTLLFSARDESRNNAAALAKCLAEKYGCKRA